MGTRANFQQVFGTSPFLWFLPIPNYLGNGMNWPAKIPKTPSGPKQSEPPKEPSDRDRLLGSETTAPSNPLKSDVAINFGRNFETHSSSEEKDDEVDFESANY
jgi:hypothetical protein